jgi:hypothetical protein
LTLNAVAGHLNMALPWLATTVTARVIRRDTTALRHTHIPSSICLPSQSY